MSWNLFLYVMTVFLKVITDAEAENMSVEDIIVDRITRLIVDY